MRITDFDTLTFDCYGTLIDWERGILDELRPWIGARGGALSDDEILEAFAGHETACQTEQPAAPYPEILEEVVRRLARRWAVAVTAETVRRFGASVGNWPAFPDSAEALRYLKEHCKLVILSNVDRASFARSNARLGVDFDRVVTAQDVGAYKPSLRNFEYLIRELAGMGIEKRRVLHTAQSRFHDIAPARQLGLATLWVDRRRGKPGWGATPAPDTADAEPHFTVGSLAELAALHRRARR